MKFSLLVSLIFLISCVGKQVKVSIKKEKQSYIKNQIEPLLSLAKENHQNYILASKKKRKNRKVYKYKSLKLLKTAYKILRKNRPFLTKEIIDNYNKTAKLINQEVKDLNFSLINFLFLPFRYIANIGKGISDIFVFKVGLGVGFGFEAATFGLNAGGYMFPLELSTAYTPQNEKSSISSTYSLSVYSPSILWTNSLWGSSVCPNFVLRDCGGKLFYKNDSKRISYTNANVWIAFGPAFMLNIETHRFVELFGIFLGKDWNITGNEKNKTQRFHYFSYKKAKVFRKKKQVIQLDENQIKLIQAQIENLEKQKELEIYRIISQKYGLLSQEKIKNIKKNEYDKYNYFYRFDTIEKLNAKIKKLKIMLEENEK